MPAILNLRIVILHLEPEVWCDICGAACAMTVTYVTEEPNSAPGGVYRLTYCETCEGR